MENSIYADYDNSIPFTPDELATAQNTFYDTALKCVKLQNVTRPNCFETVTLDYVLNEIKTGVHKPLIDKLRKIKSEENYKKFKQKLPAYALNGAFFDSIKNENFAESNGLFHFDIDHLENPQETKHFLIKSIPELFALWLSPSGNGLKGLIRIPDDLIHTDDDFKKAYKQIEQHLNSLRIEIDKSCKDVRRLCFVSHDADIYINRNAPAFLFDVDLWHEQPKAMPESTPQATLSHHDNESRYIQWCTDIILNSVKGEHHNARLRAGKLAGGYTAKGLVNESAITQALLNASDTVSSKYNDDNSTVNKERKAVLSGIENGKLSPIEPISKPRINGSHTLIENAPPIINQQLNDIRDKQNELETRLNTPTNHDQHDTKSNESNESNDVRTDIKLRFTVSYGDDLADNATAPNFIINNILETDSHGVLYGASQSFKSFLALLMAWCICTGKDFAGNQVFNAGKVLIICGEGKGGIQRRIKALKIALGSFNDNLIVLNENISIDNKEDLNGIRELVEFHKPVLVIFDTFSSLNGGINENDNSQTGAALKVIKEACTNGITSSLIIHHSGKDETKGARGAGVFKNNTDFQFEVKRSGDDMKTALICHKMKDGEKFHDLYFDAHIVELGLIRQDGNQTTSLILKHTDHTPPTAKKSLSDKEFEVLQQLRTAIEQHGIAPPDTVKEYFKHEPDKAPAKVVHSDKWRELAYMVLDVAHNSKRPTFYKIKRDLKDVHKKIGFHDDYYWII